MQSDPIAAPRPSEDDAVADRGTALDQLARRYGQALSRFFERRVERKADVPDMVQDVFLRLSRLRDLSAIAKPEHYLFTAATNTLRDRARRAAVRCTGAHERFDEDLHGGSDFSPARVLEGREAIARLNAALRTMPERTRDIFVLRVFEEQKMAEIARALGISVRATEKHYARAMAQVARALEK